MTGCVNDSDVRSLILLEDRRSQALHHPDPDRTRRQSRKPARHTPVTPHSSSRPPPVRRAIRARRAQVQLRQTTRQATADERPARFGRRRRRARPWARHRDGPRWRGRCRGGSALRGTGHRHRTEPGLPSKATVIQEHAGRRRGDRPIGDVRDGSSDVVRTVTDVKSGQGGQGTALDEGRGSRLTARGSLTWLPQPAAMFTSDSLSR